MTSKSINSSPITEIREIAFNIESATLNADILLNAIFDKLNSAGATLGPEALTLVDAISCFATCARTSVTAISEMNQQSLALMSGLVRGVQ